MKKKQYEITWDDGVRTEAEFKDSKTMRKMLLGWQLRSRVVSIHEIKRKKVRLGRMM